MFHVVCFMQRICLHLKRKEILCSAIHKGCMEDGPGPSYQQVSFPRRVSAIDMLYKGQDDSCSVQGAGWLMFCCAVCRTRTRMMWVTVTKTLTLNPDPDSYAVVPCAGPGPGSTRWGRRCEGGRCQLTGGLKQPRCAILAPLRSEQRSEQQACKIIPSHWAKW